MSRLGKCVLASALAVLALATACSRPLGEGDDPSTSSDPSQTPFQQRKQTATPTSAADAEPDRPADPDSALPFHDLSSLPAGTLLTVRLNNAISADGSVVSETFEALVDEPIIVDGVALVPRGAYAVGRIESARRSSVERDRGYVRLTLASIDVSGHDVPVQTSSLFASANAPGLVSSADTRDASPIHLEKGRRLTFRLTGPVRIPREQRISSR